MTIAALRFLLLVLLVKGNSTKNSDEICYAWAQGIASPVKSFHCPQDMKFCCGTCAEPFCCSSAEAQLDQQQCRHDAPFEAFTVVSRTMENITKKGILSWITVFFSVLLGGAALLFALYCCYTRGYKEVWRRRRNRRHPKAICDYYNRVEEENYIEPLDILDLPPSFFTAKPPCDDDQLSNNSDWGPPEDVDYPPPISIAQVHNAAGAGAEAEAETSPLRYTYIPEAAAENNLELESLLK